MLKGIFLHAKWPHILLCFTLQKQSIIEHCFFNFELVLLALIVKTGGGATILVNLVGPHVVEFLISHHTQIPGTDFFFKKAISGCTGSQLTPLLRPAIVNGNANLVTDWIDAGADVNNKNSNGLSMIGLAVCADPLDVSRILIASGCEIDLTADRVLH